MEWRKEREGEGEEKGEAEGEGKRKRERTREMGISGRKQKFTLVEVPATYQELC